jgi:hypothetical protein
LQAHYDFMTTKLGLIGRNIDTIHYVFICHI